MRILSVLLLALLWTSVQAGTVVLEVIWEQPGDDRITYFEYGYQLDGAMVSTGSRQAVDGGNEYKAHLLTDKPGGYAFRARSCNTAGCGAWAWTDILTIDDAALAPPTIVPTISGFRTMIWPAEIDE